MEFDFDRLLEKKYAPYAILLFFALFFYALIHIFSGEFGLAAHNWYNNYSRQAYSWLQGRLDLPYNRPYLEIAFFPYYGGRMYISFPPFPSMFLLPFVFFYGYNTPDHIIALGLAIVTNIYAYKIALRLLKDKKLALFFALFLTLGTNYLHISLWGAVWWLAQNMGFTLLLISIYYAISENRKHSIISLLALCASMGCRPFNTFYVPIILLLIYKREEGNFFTIARRIMLYAIPAIMLGAVYMTLNYVRFGSIFEFGHNFLPEHTIDPLGQFHPSRVVHNFSMMLFGLDMTYGIRNGFPHEGRTTFAFWLASPMFVSFVGYQIAYWNRKKDETDHGEMTKERYIENFLILLAPILVFIHIFAFSFHRTLGGRQFGSRYVADALPIIFLGLLLMVNKLNTVAKKPVEKSAEETAEAEEMAETTLILYEPEDVGNQEEAEHLDNEEHGPQNIAVPAPAIAEPRRGINKHIIYNIIPMLFGALINFHGTIVFLTFYFPFHH